MADLIQFPPTQPCHCGAKLRPATKDEIKAGLSDPDPVIRQAFAHAVQGDMSRKFTTENAFTSSVEWETDPGSWLMLCDSCGAKHVQSPPIVVEPE